MKRFLKTLLFLVLIFALPNPAKAQSEPALENEIIYKEASFKINAIDPNVQTNIIGSFFPGQRGANQLIIYTPKYGDRTNTNEFGTEAIVINNTVYQLNGADSIIPQNGFIVSGHGNANKWINENIHVGSKVFYNATTKILTTYVTTGSFLFSATEKIKETYSIMDYYRTKDIMYNDKKSVFYVEKAKDYLKQAQKHPNNVQKYSSLAIESANKAIENAIPYYKNEFKGTWIRPTETTQTDIIKTIENIKDAGIDNIFLETYFHGKTIFPSKTLDKYKVTNQREEFQGIDALRIWIDEAHKRDMKVHVWFETFYVGNENPKLNSKSILNVYPNWNNVTKAKYNSQELVSSMSEHNGYFIDPANPEVTNFLLELITEIIGEYKVDGIHLDYIRYPQSISSKYSSYDMTNWGYTSYARAEFKKLYATDPIDITYGSDLWKLWDKYRQDKITNFVASVSKLTKKERVKLTTVIFPDRIRSLETKMQDWKTWSVNNYVDGFTPLILTCDPKTAGLLIEDITRNSSPKTKVYAGLFIAFMNGSTDDVLRQIHVSRKLKVDGVIMFDWAHMQDKYINTLNASAFNPSFSSTIDKNELAQEKKELKEKEKKKKSKRPRPKGYPTE